MLDFLDVSVIAGYFAILLLFGIVVRRVRGIVDFALARRALPTSMVFASLAATYIGPGFAVGMTGRGYSSGFFVALTAAAFVLQTIAVGLFVAPRMRMLEGCHTAGDIIGRTYGRRAQVLAGVISVGMCAGFAAVMARAGAGVIGAALGWPLGYGVLLVTGVGVLYTLTGGLRSVVATEAFQFAVFAIAVPAVPLGVVLARGMDGPQFVGAAVSLTSQAASNTPMIATIGLVASFLLGETLIPPYTVRALAGASARVSQRGFVLAGMFGVLWLSVVTVIGIQATYALPASVAVQPDDVFMAMTAAFLPHGMIGLIVVALAAIVMSSQESVLNAGAVSVVRDLVQSFRSIDDSTAVSLGRATTLALGVIAGGAALFAPSIIDGLLLLYSVWAPTMLLPLLCAVFGHARGPTAGMLAIIMGGATSLSWRFLLGEPAAVPSILVGLAASAIGLVVGSLVQSGPSGREV